MGQKIQRELGEGEAACCGAGGEALTLISAAKGTGTGPKAQLGPRRGSSRTLPIPPLTPTGVNPLRAAASGHTQGPGAGCRAEAGTRHLPAWRCRPQGLLRAPGEDFLLIPSLVSEAGTGQHEEAFAEPGGRGNRQVRRAAGEDPAWRGACAFVLAERSRLRCLRPRRAELHASACF